VKIIRAEPIETHGRGFALAVAHLDKAELGGSDEAGLPRGKVRATRDPAAFPEHLGRDEQAFDICPGGVFAALEKEFGRETLVGIQVENPAVAEWNFALGEISLTGKVIEAADEDAGTGGAGDLGGAVNRAGIDDYDIVAACDRGEATGQVAFFVERENDDGEHGSAGGRGGGSFEAHVAERAEVGQPPREDHGGIAEGKLDPSVEEYQAATGEQVNW